MVNSIARNRHTLILDILNEEGEARVDRLSDKLGVSSVTIRRDLDYLNQQGMLIRTHGGASSLRVRKELEPEKKFAEKGIINLAEKERIAQRAVQLVEEDTILFLNGGSTTLMFLQALRNKRLRVVTNSAAAIHCQCDERVQLTFLGGEYREQSQSFIGDIAINTIRQIYSSQTVLGANALSVEQGLTTSVFEECTVNQSMIKNTRGSIIVLADYSKIGTFSNFVSASITSIDIVVTDDRCPDRIASQLEASGVRVIIA